MKRQLTVFDDCVVHGFEDWRPTPKQWREMMETVAIGASQECPITLNGETKTLREWQLAYDA